MYEHGDEQVERTENRLLGLLTAGMNRDAFGRQREPFEACVDVGAHRIPSTLYSSMRPKS